MKLSGEQKKAYYALINGLWDLTKKYGNPEDDDAYWDAVLKAAENLDAQFGNTSSAAGPFAHAMIMGWLSGLEKTWKCRKEADNTKNIRA